MKNEDRTDKFAGLRRLRKNKRPTGSTAPDDIPVEKSHRLLHKLEARQIELAMQNEELRTTRVELETLYHKYKNLYDFAPVGYLTISQSGLILETNLTAVLMLGAGKAALLQQPLSQFVFPDDRDAFDRYREQLAESHLRQIGELRMVGADGSPMFVRLEGVAVRDSAGQIQECRLTVSDVTAHHSIEKVVHESEERHRMISELTSDYIYSAVVHSDQMAETNWLSGSVERVTGYTMEEIRRLEGGWNAIVHPDDLTTHRSLRLRLLANESIVHEYRIFRKDGQIRWLRDYKKPVWDEAEGRVTLIWGAVQDITERKWMEEALTRYSAELEARNEELDAFAHTVSHDLKNPLNTILGYAELLADNDDPLSIEQIHLSTVFIAQAADKMNHIINELLLLASVGREQVNIRPLDMASILTSVCQILRPMIEEYQAVIVVPDTWPVALGYGPWIETVWTNYFSNAMKYGGRPPRVELGAMIEGDDAVRFWIRDNGAGLTSDDQSRLFVPFTRLAPSVAEGNGVGLSIVQRIIERLGGQINIESEVGRGSTFSFRLPRGED